MEILLQDSKDNKMLLSLGYYTNSLLQYLITESQISVNLVWHFFKSDHKSLELNKMIAEFEFFGHMLQNEFVQSKEDISWAQKCDPRLDALNEHGEISIDR
jgi:hypothetical protein